MYKTFFFSLLISFQLFHNSTGSNGEIRTEAIPKIAILGSFHFSGSNDYASITINDLSSEKRQNELDALADALSKFNPNKIMVEWEPDTKTKLDKELEMYLAGNFELPRNEIYQIGFRLAKKVGVRELFPIDYKMYLGDARVTKYLKKQGEFENFQNLISELKEAMEKESLFLSSHTMKEFYYRLNSNTSDAFNKNFYLEKLGAISNEPDSPVLDYVANWYKRNIYMMHQIDTRLQDNDRVLIILGSGHRAILKDLFKDRKGVEYVEIQDFLQ